MLYYWNVYNASIFDYMIEMDALICSLHWLGFIPKAMKYARYQSESLPRLKTLARLLELLSWSSEKNPGLNGSPLLPREVIESETERYRSGISTRRESEISDRVYERWPWVDHLGSTTSPLAGYPWWCGKLWMVHSWPPWGFTSPDPDSIEMCSDMTVVRVIFIGLKAV